MYIMWVCMIFEWDENKNRINKVKHGIDFESTTTVFDDPLMQSRVDEDVRWQTIGYSEGSIVLLFVAHTYHEADEIVVRIISARRANKHEREYYEKGSF